MTRPRVMELAGTLPEKLRELWRRQAAEWSRLSEALAALNRATVKRVRVAGDELAIQSNPGRATSAAAPVDQASLAARPCFLCPAQLPPEQHAVAFGDWWILCNPAPIFEPHYTVVSREHRPQLIADALPAMLDVAEALRGAYTVLYNGPGCGASAPDHLHMQIAPVGSAPVEAALVRGFDDALRGMSPDPLAWLPKTLDDPVEARVGSRASYGVVLLTATRKAPLLQAAERALAAWGRVHPSSPEPMANVFTLYRADRWLVWFFPRTAHRPRQYGTGPDQLLVSPGAVDMNGLLIAARPEDAARLTPELVAEIYGEVGASEEQLDALRGELTDRTS